MATNIYAHNVVNHDNHKEYSFTVNSTDDAIRIATAIMRKDRQPEDIQPEEVPQDNDQELFKYIHPAITDDTERLRVHRQVGNLAKNFPLIDICKHLQQMKKDNLVYLGVKPELMFEELHRLGMPDKETSGYSYKNFLNYFNVN